MNIFFDLDGTLVDSRLRLYKLFQFLVPESNLHYDAYWEFKKNKISNQKILQDQFSYTSIKIETFVSSWMKLIEHDDFLKFDSIYDGVKTKLMELEADASLYVCTARQFREPVLSQLEKFGLLEFFKGVMVTHQKYTKDQLIKKHVPNYKSTDWFIGDTGHDMQIGKKLKINTCAVTCGFLNLSVLEEYAPTLILNSIAEFSI